MVLGIFVKSMYVDTFCFAKNVLTERPSSEEVVVIHFCPLSSYSHKNDSIYLTNRLTCMIWVLPCYIVSYAFHLYQVQYFAEDWKNCIFVTFDNLTESDGLSWSNLFWADMWLSGADMWSELICDLSWSELIKADLSFFSKSSFIQQIFSKISLMPRPPSCLYRLSPWSPAPPSHFYIMLTK